MANGDAVGIHEKFKQDVLEKNIDLGNGGDTIKMALLTGHTPDLTNDGVWADISADECTNVSNYTAGGATLAGQAVSAVGANAKWDGTDITWGSMQVAEVPSHCNIRDTTYDCLIGTWICTTPTNGGDYTLQFHANGIMTVS